MKKPEFANKTQVDKQVDKVVTRIIRTLRRGHPAHLPGLGTLNPGTPWTFDPEPLDRQSELPLNEL